MTTFMDKTQTFSDLPGADPSVWCHVCGMPRSAVDPLVTRGSDLLCHMCAYESVVGELARLRAELEQANAEIEVWKKRYFDAGRSDDAFAADMARLLVATFGREEQTRAALELAQTTTDAGLRAQLAGSQRALTNVMGELTEARDEIEKVRKTNGELVEMLDRRRCEHAKVQADLYNKIDAEKAQTAEAYRQRDVARAALATAERERDEARGEVDRLWTTIRAIRVAQAERGQKE